MLGLAVAAMAAGCISSPTEPQQATVEPTSVQITPEALAPTGGTLERFTAQVLDSQGKPISGSSVSWTTTDPSVAIVDNDGYVWTFTEGTATATADFPGKGKEAGNGNAYGHSKKNAEISVTQVATDRPGQVTDLSVASTTTSSATLSFTEVGDGTGSPADYVVRFQVSPLDWGTATNAQSGTCSTPVDGGGIGAARTCTVMNLQPDTNYQFQLVAFRGTYPSDVVYGDLSNKASGSTPAEPNPTQQPVAPSGSDGHPNEPAGLERIAESGFDCMPGDGCEPAGDWRLTSADRMQENMSIIEAQANSGETDHVLRFLHPQGMNNGISCCRFDVWGPQIGFFGQNAHDELYVSFWLKIQGSDYENQTVGTKVFYTAFASTQRNNQSFMMLAGTYQDQALMNRMRAVYYITQMNEDGSDPGSAHKFAPNVNTDKFMEVGEWHHVELYFKANEIDRSDGKFKMWIDGVTTHNIDGLRYRSAANPLGFYNLRFSPIWGGNTDDVRTRDDVWLVDRMYLSAH